MCCTAPAPTPPLPCRTSPRSLGAEENSNLRELGRRLVQQDRLPTFEPVQLSVEVLRAEGERLVREQELINRIRLSDSYLKKQKKTYRSIIGLSG